MLNDACLGIFVVEVAIRLAAYGRRPQDFFKEGWNVFDFVVIRAVFVPGLRENATLLRLVRLLRVVRLVSVLPELRVLIRGMVGALPPIGSMGVLALLFIYVYGMLGWILFGDELPERWGDIGDGDADAVHRAHARGLERGALRGAGGPPVVVDLLHQLRAARLAAADQHPDRDHHQRDGGAPARRRTARSSPG